MIPNSLTPCNGMINSLQKLKSNKVLFSHFDDHKLVHLTVEAFLKRIQSFIHFLIQKDVKAGDKIILIPKQLNHHWFALDLAIQDIGATSVFIHASAEDEQLDYISEKTKAILVACLESSNSFDIKIQFNPSEIKDASQEFIQHKSSLGELSTIIFSSGTTGSSKGIMLSHKNIMSNVNAICSLLPISSKSRVLSFLPYSHAFERTLVWSYIQTGATLITVNDPKKLAEAFKLAKPHLFSAVPRILEKIYQQILEHAANQSLYKRKIFWWSISFGKKFKYKKARNPIYWLRLYLARIFVLRHLKKRLGGCLIGVIVGASKMNEEIARLFAASGINIREGYGLTETSPAVTVNRFNKSLNRYGTAGLALPGVEIDIDVIDEETQEGEILVRGDNVMLGYFEDPEATAKVLMDDGWLRTGDIGRLIKKRYLEITDRKKEIFKTSSGKYIAPQYIEYQTKRSEFIDQIMIIGFQKPFVSAVVVPNYLLLKEWAIESKVHWTSPKYMKDNIKVREKIQEEINHTNEELPNYMRIKDFILTDEEWTVDNGLLTATLKPIKKKITSHFEKGLKKIYKLS